MVLAKCDFTKSERTLDLAQMQMHALLKQLLGAAHCLDHVSYHRTSAKTTRGVDDLFRDIGEFSLTSCPLKLTKLKPYLYTFLHSEETAQGIYSDRERKSDTTHGRRLSIAKLSCMYIDWIIMFFSFHSLFMLTRQPVVRAITMQRFRSFLKASCLSS